MQDSYEAYCDQVRRLYPDEFWRIFGSIYKEKQTIIERVLNTTKAVFFQGKGRRDIPTSVRLIRDKILNKCGDFPSRILHEVTICLRRYQLPRVKQTTFKFINPLWAWVQAANEMIKVGHNPHFYPKAMYHEKTCERLYGVGVQFSDVLKFVTGKKTEGALPALFGTYMST